MAAVEAELAHRYCPGLSSDVEQVRQLTAERGMNYADFFMKRRSAAFQQSLAALRLQLRRDPQTACDWLWADYGSEGQKIRLLRRS